MASAGERAGEVGGEAEAEGDGGQGGAGREGRACGTGGAALSGGLSTRVTTNTLWPRPGLDTEMRCSEGEEGQPGGLLSPGPRESVGGTRAGQGASALSPSSSAPSSPSESESESESGPGPGAVAPFSCAWAVGSSPGPGSGSGSSPGWGSVTVISGMEADSCSRCSFSSRSRANTKLRLQPFWISASSAFCVSMKLFTASFLGSRSRSRRSREWFTLRANDSAMSPPVLISFSRRSSLRRRGLSAMNSATATAPSHVSLVEARPRRSTLRLPMRPFLRLRTPSFPMGLWPRFSVSRLCVCGCRGQRSEPARKEADTQTHVTSPRQGPRPSQSAGMSLLQADPSCTYESPKHQLPCALPSPLSAQPVPSPASRGLRAQAWLWVILNLEGVFVSCGLALNTTRQKDARLTQCFQKHYLSMQNIFSSHKARY
uniref:Protein phosphatase 1 regulatory subunit 37 n=1 Tax=Sus scrofa TaxID=9823 RepID=A0A480IWY7_PIG